MRLLDKRTHHTLKACIAHLLVEDNNYLLVIGFEVFHI